MTPADQSESKGDLKITQDIRKSLVADKELSVNAHNVKVITVDGTVTLRGPVDSDAEKSAVAAAAEKIAGATKVVDELEVKRR
jgi:osmotically-inducible protein OsmY